MRQGRLPECVKRSCIHIKRLTQILKAFDRAPVGRRSEKLTSSPVGDGQLAFVFEEIETAIAAIKAQVTKGRENPDGKRAPRPRKTAKMNKVDPRARFTQTLERLANGWSSGEIDALMRWNYAA